MVLNKKFFLINITLICLVYVPITAISICFSSFQKWYYECEGYTNLTIFKEFGFLAFSGTTIGVTILLIFLYYLFYRQRCVSISVALIIIIYLYMIVFGILNIIASTGVMSYTVDNPCMAYGYLFLIDGIVYISLTVILAVIMFCNFFYSIKKEKYITEIVEDNIYEEIDAKVN